MGASWIQKEIQCDSNGLFVPRGSSLSITLSQLRSRERKSVEKLLEDKYKLTPAGEDQLASCHEYWSKAVEGIKTFLSGIRCNPHQSINLVQGSLELLILSILHKKSLTQSEIQREISHNSNGLFNPRRNSISTILKRLEKRHEVTTIFIRSDSGATPTRYQLMTAGNKRWRKGHKYWCKAIEGIEPFLCERIPQETSTK